MVTPPDIVSVAGWLGFVMAKLAELIEPAAGVGDGVKVSDSVKIGVKDGVSLSVGLGVAV